MNSPSLSLLLIFSPLSILVSLEGVAEDPPRLLDALLFWESRRSGERTCSIPLLFPTVRPSRGQRLSGSLKSSRFVSRNRIECPPNFREISEVKPPRHYAPEALYIWGHLKFADLRAKNRQIAFEGWTNNLFVWMNRGRQTGSQTPPPSQSVTYGGFVNIMPRVKLILISCRSQRSVFEA